jgi:hypothetical protein
MEETLAVDVLGTSLIFGFCGRKLAGAIDQWVDLVKTCDLPESVLSNLRV